MSETLISLLRDPAVSLAATIAATFAAGAATVALTYFMITARRQLEAIEAAQAETAAFMANEVRRIGNLLVHERAAQIGAAVRQARSAPTAGRAATPAPRPIAAGEAIHQPLRKTVH